MRRWRQDAMRARMFHKFSFTFNNYVCFWLLIIIKNRRQRSKFNANQDQKLFCTFSLVQKYQIHLIRIQQHSSVSLSHQACRSVFLCLQLYFTRLSVCKSIRNTEFSTRGSTAKSTLSDLVGQQWAEAPGIWWCCIVLHHWLHHRPMVTLRSGFGSITVAFRLPLYLLT